MRKDPRTPILVDRLKTSSKIGQFCQYLFYNEYIFVWKGFLSQKISLSVTVFLSGVLLCPPLLFLSSEDSCEHKLWMLQVCVTFVFGALLEYALVNYASRSDAQRLAKKKVQKQWEIDHCSFDPAHMEDALPNNGGGSFAMVCIFLIIPYIICVIPSIDEWWRKVIYYWTVGVSCSSITLIEANASRPLGKERIAEQRGRPITRSEYCCLLHPQ